jgi:hypothetical protein
MQLRRRYSALALRMLAEIAELSENPEIRVLCRQTLEQWLLALRAMLDAPELPADLRRGIEAQLRLFWNA